MTTEQNQPKASAPTIIKPTVGRVVWYWRDADHSPATQPEAGIVAVVHSDSLVNLHVIDKDGVGCSKTNVVLRQPGEGEPNCSYCEWMPFQIGQARAQEPRSQVDGGLTTPPSRGAK